MASELPPLPPNQPFVHLDSTTLHTLLSPHLLIPHLHVSIPAFSLSIHRTPYVSYTLPSLSSSSSSSSSSSPSSSTSSTASSASNLLYMWTLWSTNPSLPYLSIKTSTAFRHNPSLKPPFPSCQSTVSLFHSLTGTPLASLDGTTLAYLRVSAVSGLVSSLLSQISSQTLLIIGCGSHLADHISAHRIARPSINRIIIWNPNTKEALDLIYELRMKEPDSSTVTFDYAQKLDEVIGLADIVSCVSKPTKPIVKGNLLKPGAHLDLVGSLSSKMKECDDETLLRGRVFLDFELTVDEAGDVVGVYDKRIIRREYVAGTLTELVVGKKIGRERDDEVTVFKSVGSAVVDLLAAQLAYESYIKK